MNSPTDPQAGSARFEPFIIAGLLVFLLVLPHRILGDARARFDALALLLDHGRLTPIAYSYVGPLFSAPLYYLGKLVADPEWWCARYNTLLLAGGFAAVYALLKEQQERAVLRTFFLILLAASMFPNHLMNFNAEPFTAVMAMVGVAAISTGRAVLGWTLLAIGVVNTPAAIVGLLFVALTHAFEKRRVTPLIAVAAAAALILLESWIRRGSPFLTGYEHNAGVRTVMPYSGLPGFSYPLMFGLLSILFSFGKGLVFYTPGLLVRMRRDDARWAPRLWECYQYWLLFLAGLVIVYAKWWAWYGGTTWGPRFFLAASLPASLAIAVALRRAPALSRMAALGALTALAFSVWVCIDGAVFDQANLGICTQNDWAQEFLCWYTPEFSALWRPFVAPSPISWSGIVIIAFCLVSFVALVPATVRRMLRPGPKRPVTHQEAPMRAALKTLVLLVSFGFVLPNAARAQNQEANAVGFDLAWNHVALSVPNIAESIAWYEKMLGFKGQLRGQPNPNARQQVADLRRGDITIELFQLADAAPLPESRKNPSEDFRTHGVKHFGFEVKNLPAVLAELKAKGVKMAFEMRDTPTERFAFISDNAGNAIELIEHKTAR